MTENEIRNLVVNTAQKYFGCKESDGSHKKIIDIYNAHKPLARGYSVKYTDAWCATYVSAVAILCGLTDIMPTECSCSKMIDLYKKLGRWEEADDYIPKIGDVLMYDWNDSSAVGNNTGNPDHVGIVAYISGNTMKIIEGNISDSVNYRTMSVNARYIRGYCLPDYASKATEDKQLTTAPTKSVDEVAKEVLTGKWGNGNERKKALTEAGYDFTAVQAKVNELASKPATTIKSLETIAKEVINGEWGNGTDRKKKLNEAGYSYSEVQKMVNKLLAK